MDRSFLALFVACALAASAQAAEPARSATLGTDRFSAGGTVVVGEPVGGDLIAAGGRVEVTAPVKADAVAAGGEVRVESEVGQSLYAGAGRITIGARVGHNARIAGGHVEVTRNGSVDGNLTAAGGEVRIDGPVKGYVQAGGGHVVIDTTVGGDAVVSAGRLELGPNARIGGNLSFRGGELLRDAGAQVSGTVSEVGHEARGNAVRRNGPRVAGWIWTVGLMVLAAIFVAALPSLSNRLVPALAERPAIAVLYGFLALVAIPAAVLVMMITIVGLPLALLALLTYLALLLVGYVATAVALGDAAVRSMPGDATKRTAWRIAAAALAVLVLALLGRVPWLGGFVSLAALVVGVGTLVSVVFPRSPRAPAEAATSPAT